MKPPCKIIMCRSAADSLLPQHERGYICRLCGTKLQVSPEGRAQIAAGGTPVCNKCGLAFVKEGAPEAIVFNPAVKTAMGLPSFSPSARSLLQSLDTRLERRPSGAVDLVETIGSRGIPERPQWLVCDCCCERVDRLWYWRHYGFCTRLPGCQSREFMAGWWAFCVYCRKLKNDRRLLVARVATLNPDLRAQILDDTYEIMLACLYGEVHEWRSGQPGPTTE
jgi:hypothetical protein